MISRYEGIAGTIKDYCQQYLDEEEKLYIPYISIAIDGVDCTFWITDSSRLIGYIKPQPQFRLAIYFSIANNSKKKMRLIERLAVSDCFSGFIERSSNRNSIYVLETDNNTDTISQQVIKIITSLSPEIEAETIKVKLKRYTRFYTLYDGDCT